MKGICPLNCIEPGSHWFGPLATQGTSNLGSESHPRQKSGPHKIAEVNFEDLLAAEKVGPGAGPGR